MPRPGRINVYPLIVLHLLIAVPLAWWLNIWADEASTLYSTQQGIGFALQNAAFIERQAPLYFWVMALWRDVSGSIFFARLFSIICSVVAIRVFAGLASRLLDWRGALLATAFFALHPILIWASAEIRVYALVMLLSVSLLRLFYEGFFADDSERPNGRWWRRGFLVVAVVSLYTNYYIGFLLLGLKYAVLMGVTAAMLNLIPYVGPWIGSLIPISIALLITWSAATAEMNACRLSPDRPRPMPSKVRCTARPHATPAPPEGRSYARCTSRSCLADSVTVTTRRVASDALRTRAFASVDAV